jgi:hypothetical protein
MLNPDRWITEALAEGEDTTSDNPLVLSLVALISGKSEVSPALSSAMEIWTDLTKRGYIEAYLLVADVPSVSMALDMPGDIVSTYKEHFFDTDVFQDKLQRYAYVNSLPQSHAKELKLLALTMGKGFIDWRLGNTLSISPDEVLSRLLTDSYAMAKLGMQSGMVTSKSSKEAYRWATLAAKLADTLSRRAAEEETNDIYDGLQVIPVFDDDDIQEALDIAPELIVRG